MNEGSIIIVDNLKTDIFKYDNDYYSVNDFMQMVITTSNGIELNIDDYSYINFSKDISNINDFTVATISKDILEIGCKIKRVYTDTYVEGITVEKVMNDNNNDTFAYKYVMQNGGLSSIQIGTLSSGDWMSIDSKEIAILGKMPKIQYILELTNENDCQETVNKLRQIVFDKQQ